MPTASQPQARTRCALAWVAGRLRHRPDREHEMVVNRLAISSILMIYLVVSGLLHTMEVHDAIIANAVYGCVSLGFFVHLLLRPGTCHPRRIVGMFIDIGALTYCLYVGGATTAVLWPIYLWIIFGNGFRFGLRYIFAAMGLGFLGFSLLLATSDYWSATGHLGYGLLAGLVVLPTYTSTLIKNLNKAKQQAEEASKAKSTFLASVSHELRTPLNAVIGMSDLLNDSRLNAEQSDMICTISASARSLLALIEEILNFSRLEAGRMPIQLTEIDLYAVLSQVRAMLTPAAREKGLRLSLHITPRTPQHVCADGKHVEEVLVNLVGNALKFTHQGDVLISVDAVEELEGKSRIRFEISDTGIGIAPEALGRIFESFTQADETIINRYGGTGLGLAICRELVELQGGRIGVESQVGSGSTFWFELDVEQRSGNEPAQAALAGTAVILLGVREEASSYLLSALARLGVKASPAADIESARAQLWADRGSAKGRPIVVFDESSAWFAAEAAQALNADLIGPSFLLARDDGDRPLSRDERVLFTSAITKPFNEADLTASLVVAIGGSARPHSLIADTAVPRRSLSVLIADDNRTNQKVLSKILERGGHCSTVVNNGEEAVDMLLNGTFDIVFMDVNMPVMNGIEATKLYRFAALGRERVPIVALTADATPEARARCEEAGMDGCVTKPIEAAQLFRIIDSLVPVQAPDPVATPILDDTVAEISAHPRFRPDTRAIDAATIERLQQLGGTTFVVDLADEFIAEGARIIEELKASAASHDIDAFSDRAHALRSGAANIGALRLYELCLALRTLGSAELARNGAEKAREIEAEFARVRLDLADFQATEARGGSHGVNHQGQSTAATGVIRQLRSPVPTSAGSAQR